MKKNVRKLRRILGFFDPLFLDEEMWNSLDNFAKVSHFILIPLVAFSSFAVTFFWRECNYPTFLISISMLWVLIMGVYSFEDIDYRHHKITKQQIFSNLAFDFIFIVLFIEIFKKLGYYLLIKEEFIRTIQSAKPSAHYLYFLFAIMISYIFFTGLSYKVRKNLLSSFKTLKNFLRTPVFRSAMMLIFFSLNFIIWYAIIYYIEYLFVKPIQFEGINNASVFDFTGYSFSIFFSVSVSDIKSISFISKFTTGTEALSSYFLLVIFLSYVIDKKSSDKKKLKRIRNIKRIRKSRNSRN